MSSQKLSSRAEFTRNLLVEYEAIRGKKPDSGGSAFWDMVVISAGAESQKAWYEEQAWTICHYIVVNTNNTPTPKYLFTRENLEWWYF